MAPDELDALQSLKCVTIRAEVAESGLQPSVDKLLEWLGDYNAAWLRRTGIAKGRHAHLLYDRTVLLDAAGMEGQLDDLLRLAHGVTTFGMGFVWRVHVDELLRSVDACPKIISEPGIGMFVIVLNDSMDEHVEMGLQRLLGSGRSMQLVGSAAMLMRSDLLKTHEYNARHVQIVNVPPGDDVVLTKARTQPCRRRLAATIASDGSVYPCPYLAGMPPDQAIGHVDDPDRMFASEASKRMRALARSGPEGLPEILTGSVQRRLPIECQFHLNRIQETIAHAEHSAERNIGAERARKPSPPPRHRRDP